MKRRNPKPTHAAPARSALVEIEKPIYGGSFLARVDGKATFVPLMLPGEQVRVRMVEEKKGYATAEPEEIVAAAANRITPGCKHFGACGGCQYQHTDYASQINFKQSILRETLQRGGVAAPETIDVIAGKEWQYRNRIRLAFDGAGQVGYRARRSHALVPISECPIAAPLLVKAALALSALLSEYKLRATEVSLFCNADETQLLASIFVRDSAGQASAARQFGKLFDHWRERVSALAGAELIYEDQAGKISKAMASVGAASISYGTGGFAYRVDHGAFFQVNRWLVDELIERVTANWQDKLAWDLFAGVGLFARRLTARFDQVVAVESAPAAVNALKHNLEGTAGRMVQAETLSFLRNQLGKAKPDLVVVDPPRAGLGTDTTSLLATIGPPAMTYVSCDPATLARDLHALIGHGYAVKSVTLVDLFPQTFHLESVVELRRS